MGARCAVESPPPLNTITQAGDIDKSTLEEKKKSLLEGEEEAGEIPGKKEHLGIPDIKREDSDGQAGAVSEDVGSESSTLPLTCNDSVGHNGDGDNQPTEGGLGVNDSAPQQHLLTCSPVTPSSDITTVTRLTPQTPQPGGDRDSATSNAAGGEGHAITEEKEEAITTLRTMENFVVAMSQLKLTKPAPEWRGTAVVNAEFKEISSSDYRGKYLVFFFYPLDFTFVCPTEIIAFSERVEEFRSIGCEVVACSTDSHFSHLAWVNTPRKQGGLGEMKIPLLADKTCEIAKAYGVLKEDEGIAFRGLFVVDDKGNLRQITINDLPVGRSVDETLRLVQAFQFTDKHGEVCPAGWKPGKATMKPDPKNSKSYFADNN